MRGKILVAAAMSAAALTLAACGGGASEQRTKLVELCKKSEAKTESCECQVDVMLKDGDPKLVAFMVAMAGLDEKVKTDPAGAAKAMEDAIKGAGFADDAEFTKAMGEMQTKLGPQIEACKT